MISDFLRVVDTAHFFVSNFVKKGDIVVDATCGNGADTLFLSKKVKDTGKVFAIDIQDKAIQNTKELLEKNSKYNNWTLIKEDHSNILEIIPKEYYGKVSVIMFNLGYLPNSNKKIKTNYKSTLKALKESLEILSKKALITIAVYPHLEGQEEARELKDFLSTLTGDLNAFEFIRLNRNEPPYLLLITKN